MTFSIEELQDNMAFGKEVHFKYADKVFTGIIIGLDLIHSNIIDEKTFKPMTTGGYMSMKLSDGTVYDNIPLRSLNIKD